MNPAEGLETISLKLNPEQIRYLENARQFIETATGCSVSTNSVLMRLLENGLPAFEDEMRRLRAKTSRETKRFQRLHLAYSRHG